MWPQVLIYVLTAGVDHLISFTATDGKVLMRHYRILLKRSGLRTPLVDVR